MDMDQGDTKEVVEKYQFYFRKDKENDNMYAKLQGKHQEIHNHCKGAMNKNNKMKM